MTSSFASWAFSDLKQNATEKNRIPLEQTEGIVRAFEDEEGDYLLVADTLQLNPSMARGIVARYIRESRIRERPIGGRNNVRVDDEMRHCLEEIINENCLLTLTQINHELRRRLPVKYPWPHRIKDIRWDAVSSETGKDPPCWQKQTWCAEQDSWLRDMVYELCRSATLCVGRRMRLQHLDGQKSW